MSRQQFQVHNKNENDDNLVNREIAFTIEQLQWDEVLNESQHHRKKLKERANK